MTCRLRLELFKGAWASGAKQVASIGNFEIDTHRLGVHAAGELIFRLLKVAAHLLDWLRNTGNSVCHTSLASASWSAEIVAARGWKIDWPRARMRKEKRLPVKSIASSRKKPP